MSFFPPDPEPSEPEESEFTRPPWWGVPDDEIPATLSLCVLLSVTDHVSIALVAADVYRSGVELRFERRLRRLALPLREWNELSSTFMEDPRHDAPLDPSGRLRYGLVLSDGQRVYDNQPWFIGTDSTSPPDGYVFARSGGGATGGSRGVESSDRLWLWPAPPSGMIELVMQWPATGIEECRATIDGDQLGALARQVKTFWD